MLQTQLVKLLIGDRAPMEVLAEEARRIKVIAADHRRREYTFNERNDHGHVTALITAVPLESLR